MKNPKILICGGGIAGPTLAYWLQQYGFEPMLIEHAPMLREGGYLIDFWGLGFDVAEKMGLVPALRDAGYVIDELRLVNERGKRVGGFSAQALFRSTLGDRYLSILRSDLSKLIQGSLGGRVATVFGESITAIEQGDDGVRVSFKHAAPACFDLVIGAGGLHSPVRQLIFGPENRFEKYLGYYTASFDICDYPFSSPRAYVSYAEPGRQISRYSLRGDRTVIFLVFAREDKIIARQDDIEEHKDIIRDIFARDGWECPIILAEIEKCTDLYFDAVSQIRMDAWSQGRVALVGDACFCPSLLAGQGAALAMAGAYILAGELKKADGDHNIAFSNYEKILHPLIVEKQLSAERFARFFAPKTKFGIIVRNQITRLMSLPFVAKLAMGRMLFDSIKLPVYD